MGWPTIVLWVVTLLSAVYFYRQASQPLPPPGVNEFKAPTSQSGREIPVLFGCREIRQYNWLWFGDVVTKAIRKKSGKK